MSAIEKAFEAVVLQINSNRLFGRVNMLKLKKIDETASVPAKESGGFSADKLKGEAKKLIQKIGRRNLTIALAVFMIGGAVLLNFALFGKKAVPGGDSGVSADQGNVEQNAGDGASLAGADNDGKQYFAEAVINRQRARDEAMEVLQLVLDNKESLEEAKSVAMAEMTQIAVNIERESNIESLISAKGFDNSVAVINGSSCNIIVNTDGLLPNEVAQIQEIVYEQAGILPENMKIIEKKA